MQVFFLIQKIFKFSDFLFYEKTVRFGYKKFESINTRKKCPIDG